MSLFPSLAHYGTRIFVSSCRTTVEKKAETLDAQKEVVESSGKKIRKEAGARGSFKEAEKIQKPFFERGKKVFASHIVQEQEVISKKDALKARCESGFEEVNTNVEEIHSS